MPRPDSREVLPVRRLTKKAGACKAKKCLARPPVYWPLPRMTVTMGKHLLVLVRGTFARTGVWIIFRKPEEREQVVQEG